MFAATVTLLAIYLLAVLFYIKPSTQALALARAAQHPRLALLPGGATLRCGDPSSHTLLHMSPHQL